MVTAALAAGLTTFAAHAEGPDFLDQQKMAAVKASAIETKSDTDKGKPQAVSAVSTNTIDGMDMQALREVKTGPAAEIDRTVTSSIRADAPTAAVGGGAYSALISKYAAAHGVPVALATAVVRIESNFRPNARGGAGEVGLMQIKPATARAMGYSGSTKGLYDPATNIRFGMKYLGMAHQLGGGDTCGTILRYNAGHGAKRMNKVSSAYCAKVKRYLAS